ncbi:MAG: sulfite exporter TauE/SafE family protein [Tateyamaria sp.]|uniref:sulfite exporter TauE/SafE family protein n=1 Tax=Tateyamaria sp. TaxID=1929288 RepID=UPI0032833E8B
MLQLDFWFFALAAPAVIFAGVSKGGFGSGASFVAASILALVIEPALALGVMLPLYMVIDAASLRPFWGKWDWRVSGLMIAGGLPGVALGAWLFSHTEPDAVRVLIGAISLMFVAWQLARARGWVRLGEKALPHWLGVVTGCVAGFTSFVSHAGGPPAAVYLLSLKFSKTQYQANTVLIFTAINIFKFVPYAFLGMFTLQTFTANLVLAPFAVFGTWLGVKAHHLVPERAFFMLTYVLLIVTGTKLIWDGLA